MKEQIEPALEDIIGWLYNVHVHVQWNRTTPLYILNGCFTLKEVGGCYGATVRAVHSNRNFTLEF